MPTWLQPVLTRVRALAAARQVRFTLKARQGARRVLAGLTVDDAAGRLRSVSTGEWMYLFKPPLAGVVLYLKVILRNDCIVVSFHEDQANG